MNKTDFFSLERTTDDYGFPVWFLTRPDGTIPFSQGFYDEGVAIAVLTWMNKHWPTIRALAFMDTMDEAITEGLTATKESNNGDPEIQTRPPATGETES